MNRFNFKQIVAILSLGVSFSSILALAATTNGTIDCSDDVDVNGSGRCSPSSNLTGQPIPKTNPSGLPYFALDIGSPQKSVNVLVRSGSIPDDLRLSVHNGAYPDGNAIPGYDLNVDLSSLRSGSNSGNFILVGDNFKNLSVSLNGYMGKTGKNASQICADNIKNGLYGADTLGVFNGLRLNNPQLSSSACSLDDITYLQNNKFACPSGFNEVITNNSLYSVNVQQIPKYNRCQTSLSADVCLKRKIQVNCQWNIFNGQSTIIGNLTAGTNQISNAYSFKANTTAASTQITATTSLSGVSVGQALTGYGLPSGVTITNISGSTITLSQAAQVTSTSVPILAGVSTSQMIWGGGVPDSTSIASISADASSITISLSNQSIITNLNATFNSATPSSYGAAIFRKIPENQYYYFKNLMSNTDLCNLHVAQEVSDSTYVAQGQTTTFKGTTINGSPIILSPASFYATTTRNSTIINVASIPSGVTVGQNLIGLGIPSTAIISAIGGNTITMSVPATADGTGIGVLSGIELGQTVTGTGIPSNSSITAIQTTPTISLTISQNATSDQSNAAFTASSVSATLNPLFSNPNDYAGCTGNCIWKVSSVTANLTTPGMVGDSLAPGSDWEMYQTTPGQSCDTSNNSQTGFWSTYKTKTFNYVEYDSKDAQCNVADLTTYQNGLATGVYLPLDIDPNKQAQWFYTGIAQEPDFGAPNIACSIGDCPVNAVVSDLNQQLDSIVPQDGESGTQQGSGIILIYDAVNVTQQSNIGVAGAGGKNDIINQSNTRVCAKVRDAASDGLNSDYARNPMVVFNRYQWSALKSSGSGNNGQQPVNTGNTITIWKKLDNSVRYFIQNDFLFKE